MCVSIVMHLLFLAYQAFPARRGENHRIVRFASRDDSIDLQDATHAVNRDILPKFLHTIALTVLLTNSSISVNCVLLLAGLSYTSVANRASVCTSDLRVLRSASALAIGNLVSCSGCYGLPRDGTWRRPAAIRTGGRGITTGSKGFSVRRILGRGASCVVFGAAGRRSIIRAESGQPDRVSDPGFGREGITVSLDYRAAAILETERRLS